MVARRHHGAGALGSSSSGVVRFLVKLAFTRATALLHRKIVSTSRAKMYQAPPELELEEGGHDFLIT